MKKKTKVDAKLIQSIDELKHAMDFYDKALDDRFFFSGISKTYETCLEYAWKYFKRRATEEGIEAYSPKEAIKIAGRLRIIDDVEKWLDFLEDRNLSVHDYLGISQEDYLKTIKKFLVEVEKVVA